jgi:hypothetical protein
MRKIARELRVGVSVVQRVKAQLTLQHESLRNG